MQPIKLKIETPCTEGWDTMQPNKEGRFCQSCEKTVIDFTKMSDTEILDFFEKRKTQSICGHIRKSQLNRVLQPITPPMELRRSWKTVLAGLAVGVSLLGLSPDMQARTHIINTEQHIGKEAKDANTLPDPVGLRGYVLVDTVALEGATVSLYSGDKFLAATTTDSKGYFQFDAAVCVGENLRVGVMIFGYQDHIKEINTDTNREQALLFQMLEEEIHVDGGMMWEEPETQEVKKVHKKQKKNK